MLKLKDLLPECEDCGRDWNHGHDHEASMAKNELRDMISNASKIDNLVGDNDQLPGWVSAYISLAADYMHSVAEFLAGEATEPEHQPGPGYTLSESSAERVEAQYLRKGDILGSGEEVTSSPSAGTTTPKGKVELSLTKDGKTRRVVYGKYTVVTRLKKGVAEAKKPSAGLTKKEKSTVAKKAAAGKDIGKKGKGFEKIAKAAGGGEKGQKIAAAAMWKNIKR